jgi:mycothiol synthase
MNTLIMRPFAGEADLTRLVDLINACDEVDRFERGTSVGELRVELDDPNFDKHHDLRLWEDEDGRLVGAGFVFRPESHDHVDGWLGMHVHPDARGGALDDEIIEWGESRLREAGQTSGKPLILRAGTRSEDTRQIALLEQHGYTVARYFWRMKRPLAMPIPEPHLPGGITLRSLANQEEAAEWVECYNESFIDHWNHHPMTVQRRRYWVNYPSYNIERDLIAVAEDGRFAGFCLCMIDHEENLRNGANEGWIAILGTRRGFRGIGLGRALLLAGLQRLKHDGADSAKLGVDAANPNGATRLYESVGFVTAFTEISYAKNL